ncbi:TPA: hypothetical protein ACH7Y8_004672, partial [Escherichia coli]
GTADRNRSHWSTSKTPSYTKSVSWQHHPFEKPPAMPEDIYFATTVTVTAGKYTSVQNSPVVDPKNTHRSRYLWLYDYHH